MIGANSVNPIQNTSAIATQGTAEVTLQDVGGNEFFASFLYNPDRIGSWIITMTNLGDKTSLPTNDLLGVDKTLPFVSNINVSGDLLIPTITWVLPVTSVPYTRVRVRIATGGNTVFTSNFLPTSTTTYTLTSGVLQPDRNYLLRVILEEGRSGYLVNRSDTRVAYTTRAISSPVGVFRDGHWYLDANGNGAWDKCGTDLCPHFGQAGDLPASGNWDGGTKSYFGVLRSGTGQWIIDLNGNQQWDDCVADGCYSFGAPGDLPVAGDWNGSGFAKIGVFRNGHWYLDANGNGTWDKCGTDLCPKFGQAGDLPVAGNWNGGITAGVGVFRAGTWYLDYNGNGAWDGCQQDGGQDLCLYGSFGQAGDLPAAGDWNGDGKAKVGVFRAGKWYLDYNGNGVWDGCDIDRCYFGNFGQAGDLPVAGKW